MRTLSSLATQNDQAILRGLKLAFKRERSSLADLLAHIAEVDSRRLYASEGYETITSFVTAQLGLRDWEAGNRITAARLVRRFPVLLPMIERGDICLTSLTKLGPALTEANHADVLAQVKGLSTREVERLRATLDGELAEKRAPLALSFESRLGEPQPHSMQPFSEKTDEAPISPVTRSTTRSSAPSPAARRPDKVKYVAPNTVEVRFQAEDALLSLLDEVTALARSKGIIRELAEVLAHVAQDYVERHHLECQLKRKLDRRKIRNVARRDEQAASPIPPSPSHPGLSRSIPQRNKDEALMHHGYRCAYVSPAGQRCTARHGLQFDHIIPYALGGSSIDPGNIRPLCASHNRMMADRIFGRDFMASKIEAKRRDSGRPEST